ncbi:protein of unknown function DUF547 [Macleaya cordata]|uniref:DUF547 domain-containing protein n=1 Tax=Macleaya cordata TaxID=56857 RepID=A0A200R9E6_MACCD|nr:protein of unknown function DUF547 [Macleaya cordata]
MLCVNVTPHDYKMCDSPVTHFALNLSDSPPKGSKTTRRECTSGLQLDFGHGFQSDNSMIEVRTSGEEAKSLGSFIRQNIAHTCRLQLERDVQRLQQQLEEEMELRAVLENAVEHKTLTSSNLSCLPHSTKELLSSIATLEITVSDLEEEMVSLQFQLSQERNERRLAEYRLKHSSSQSLFLGSPDNMKRMHSYTSRCLEPSIFEPYHSSGKKSCQKQMDEPSETSSSRSSITSLTIQNTEDSVTSIEEKRKSKQMLQHVVVGKFTKEMPIIGLWDHPNKLSEEMVRCMKNIFISLADSSTASSKSPALNTNLPPLAPHGHFSSTSLWTQSERSTILSWVQSPQVDMQSVSEVLAAKNAFDPYRVRGKLSWADIGTYGSAIEVSWMSVGKKHLEYAAGALRRFRSLVEQLAKVNPIHLSDNEKLAFWINLYNALIMHAYLAYGVPRSESKLFSLMQKAAYTVGGHSFSAAAIEYVILKMQPPVHRPQTALLLGLQKLKVPEEQRNFSIDILEPLVAFALSCGMYSSPAVRIYSVENVREELQEAQRDFIRASVGVSRKGKLLVPKMLYGFARGFVDDSNIAVWISQHLPSHQAAFVEKCVSKRRQSLLGCRNCAILPFDSRFRYLFLPA